MIKKLENRRVKEKIIYSEVFASEMSSLGFGHALSFVCMCSQAFVLLFVTRWNYMFYSVPFKFSISCVYFLFFLNLIHCISFAKYQNESATGIHVLPILNPPPSSLPTLSLWVVPVHQPQASSIVHRTWTGNSFHT